MFTGAQGDLDPVRICGVGLCLYLAVNFAYIITISFCRLFSPRELSSFIRYILFIRTVLMRGIIYQKSLPDIGVGSVCPVKVFWWVPFFSHG